MEYVSEGLLKIVDDFFLIFKFFGDLVFINFKFKYLLIFKFLLMRSYFNMNVFYNIIGYLFGCKYRYLLVEVLYIFFDIWGDRSVIKYIIYDQYFYVTCVVVFLFGYLNIEERKFEKYELLNKLLVGVQSYLESFLEKV